MIPRRIAEHVKAHNWFAVAIDFLIVVIGVFIGIQVSNWNDVRKARAAEAALLERLAEEFETMEPALAHWVEQMKETTASTGAVVEALRAEQPPADVGSFRRDLAQANFVRTAPALSANYIALVSSGAIASIRDEQLRISLIRYGDANAQAERFYPIALATVFDPQANYLAAVDWSMDPAKWESDDAVVDYDWQKLRASRAEMQSWITFQNELTQLTNAQLAEIRTILALLRKRDQ